VRKVQLSHKNMITIKEYDQNKQLLVDLNLNTIENLMDYQNPDSCGALVKAALICSGIVHINSNLNINLQFIIENAIHMNKCV
jgi:hypothetical protein